MERVKRLICEPCRVARKKQYQRKWRRLHNAGVHFENQEKMELGGM